MPAFACLIAIAIPATAANPPTAMPAITPPDMPDFFLAVVVVVPSPAEEGEGDGGGVAGAPNVDSAVVARKVVVVARSTPATATVVVVVVAVVAASRLNEHTWVSSS